MIHRMPCLFLPELVFTKSRLEWKEGRPGEESLTSAPSPKPSNVDDHSCRSKKIASVGTQLDDQIFEEHCYIKRQHSVTYVNQSIHSSLLLRLMTNLNLYTRLALHTFHTLVAILHPLGVWLNRLKLNSKSSSR